MSDQIPDKTDSISEYKRDLPFGFSTSFAVHITAAILLFTVVASAIAVSDAKYPIKEQKSTIITIETLVRTPTTAAHQTQPSEQRVARSATSSSSSASSASSSPAHGARSTADSSASTSGGVRTEISKLASSLPRIKPAMSAVAHAFTGAASEGSASASGSNGSGGATNGQSTVNGPGPSDVDNGGRGHTGPVWGEEQADGPFGHAHGDSCTPSRGGWFH
ncbi:MAG: hypothetical protein JO219_03020 [Candidatus Eremiobacteraeota bacterium]|nr:hypothetical protein [Candidatus Eremiobacteraeota bacterium]MBV8364881.1 hypothetical protein [Candidatus Eremiobacteraeota bacterium]